MTRTEKIEALAKFCEWKKEDTCLGDWFPFEFWKHAWDVVGKVSVNAKNLPETSSTEALAERYSRLNTHELLRVALSRVIDKTEAEAATAICEAIGQAAELWKAGE